MALPIEYFEVNYAFGLVVARIIHGPIATVLKEWTNIPLRLGIAE